MGFLHRNKSVCSLNFFYCIDIMLGLDLKLNNIYNTVDTFWSRLNIGPEIIVGPKLNIWFTHVASNLLFLYALATHTQT